MADAQTPARQCRHCRAWVWLPNWWRHAQRCDLRKPANDKGERTPEARSAGGGPLDPPVVPL